MADTCIVCLGDLGESASDPPAITAEAAPRPDLQLEGKSSDGSTRVNGVDDSEVAGPIARLIPCGHVLHDNCLKPWVQRANSCPICRRNFNVVELSDQVGGPTISSYAVPDRVQVADWNHHSLVFDNDGFPSWLLDGDENYFDVLPCTICGNSGDDETLILCDHCDNPYHTYCVGLDGIPTGGWYCSECQSHRPRALSPDTARPAQTQGRRPRPRARPRRRQSRNQMNSLRWARVWRSVLGQLNLDRDVLFSDRAAERALQQQRQEEANQREFQAWQRRFEVAQRQGGGSRFRDTAALLDIGAPRPSRPRAPREPTPAPESLEEMRAWNAFERAREIENNPNTARKRKEPTLSPSPEPTEPQRKLKRPRTRRPQELAALALQNGESSRAVGARASARINAETPSEPSFLQSLLKEVEESSNPSRRNSLAPPAPVSVAPADRNAIGPSSPLISPAPSNHSSPRLSSATPPPYPRSRPISPFQLASPTDLSSPPFSPTVSPSDSNNGARETSPWHSDSSRSRVPRASLRSMVARSPETSPNRPDLSLAVKSDIQNLVKAALAPYYQSKVVSKDHYKDINRTISRMLYERVGDAGSWNTDVKNDLGRIATEEVKKAIDGIQPRTEEGQHAGSIS